MKNTKMIIRSKGKLQSTDNFLQETQATIDKYINNGYEIKASNMTSNGNFAYLYFLLERSS